MTRDMNVELMADDSERMSRADVERARRAGRTAEQVEADRVKARARQVKWRARHPEAVEAYNEKRRGA